MTLFENSKEFNLLLTCCRVNTTINERSNRLTILLDGFNEDLFYELVIRHRVVPIVFHNLKNEFLISDCLKKKLKKLNDANVVKTLASLQMAIKIQNESSNLKLNSVFLKGFTLAKRYYGDISLRHTMDLDFWIENKGIYQFSKFFNGQGFYSESDFRNFNKREQKYLKLTGHDMAFIPVNNSLFPVLEMHWRIRGNFGNFNFCPLEHNQKLEILNFGNVKFRVFNDIDNFLYLCTHGTEHGWFRLKWLFDLPQILDTVEFDWPKVLQRAQELNCSKQLIISFVVLNKLFGEEIPKEIVKKISRRKIKKPLKFIYKSILSPTIINENDKNRISHLRFLISQSGIGFFSFGLILKYLTSPNDWKLLPLPSYLFFLYFPLRPFLLLWRRITKH